MERDCNLLYKQELNIWAKQQETSGKFDKKDIELVTSISLKENSSHSSLFLTDQNSSHSSLFLTDQRVGCTMDFYVDISNLELLRLTNQNGAVKIFKLGSTDIETDNLEASQAPSNARHQNCTKFKASSNNWPVYLRGVVSGSFNGRNFLGFSKYGHLILINLKTKIGTFLGKWPIDQDFVDSHTCFGYTPDMTGAVSCDGSLVAVIGPTLMGCDDDNFDEDEDDLHVFQSTHYHLMRVYDIKSHQCYIRELPLHPFMEVLNSYISIMAFNPSNQNLLYLMVEDRSKGDEEYPHSSILVLYDFKEDLILATRREFLLTSYMGSTLGYTDVEGPFFLHHGEIIIVYHMVGFQSNKLTFDCIALLNAFSLGTIATVNLSPIEVALTSTLRYHFLISTCQTEIAIFNKNDDDNEVQVYKIPDYDISLKNLCRRTIVSYLNGEIDDLTMLPSRMRDYLKGRFYKKL